MYEFNNTLRESNNQFFKHMPVLLLILNAGMRIGEALALEWQKRFCCGKAEEDLW